MRNRNSVLKSKEIRDAHAETSLTLTGNAVYKHKVNKLSLKSGLEIKGLPLNLSINPFCPSTLNCY